AWHPSCRRPACTSWGSPSGCPRSSRKIRAVRDSFRSGGRSNLQRVARRSDAWYFLPCVEGSTGSYRALHAGTGRAGRAAVARRITFGICASSSAPPQGGGSLGPGAQGAKTTSFLEGTAMGKSVEELTREIADLKSDMKELKKKLADTGDRET